MKLQQFIAQTLTDICKGIQTAKEQLYDDAKGVIATADNKQEYAIEFDIAVTIQENQTHQQDGSVKTTGLLQVIGMNVNLGTDSATSNTSHNTNRIKFSVPYYPHSIKRTIKTKTEV